MEMIDFTGTSVVNKDSLTQNPEKEGTTQSVVSKTHLYPRRPGANDVGKDYEMKITTLVALRCALMKETKHIWLTSNLDQVGDFDDIVLCIETTEGLFRAYMIQNKHQEKPKNITLQDFMYAHKNKSGKRDKSKEDFSILKYSRGFDVFRNRIAESKDDDFEIIQCLSKANELFFVLYTNKSVNECEFLENIQNPLLDFLDTSEDPDNIYKFHDMELDCDKDFLGKLILFTNQAHISNTDKLIKKEIRNLLNSWGISEVDVTKVTKKFTEFINIWALKCAKEEAKNIKTFYTLTKYDIINKLIAVILEPYQLKFVKEKYGFYEDPQKTIWNEILADKTFIVIDNDKRIPTFLKQYLGSEVKQYLNQWKKRTWSDHVSRNLFDKLLTNSWIIENNNQITLFDIYKSLWINTKLPLVLQINSAKDYQIVVKTLKLNNKLRVIILTNGSFDLINTPRFITNPFFNLEDLNGEDRMKVLNQGIKLQGRSGITCKELISEHMYKYLNCQDIIKILSNDFNIGTDNSKNIMAYFIERSLSKVLLVRDVLETNEFFVIKNFEFNHVHHNVINADDVEDVIKLRKKPVHFLTYHNEYVFEWNKSLGSIQNIRKYKDKYYYKNFAYQDGKIKHPVDIDKLWFLPHFDNFWNTIRVISANPGTGKSVLMDFIAQKAPIGMWVIKINLNEHSDYYRKLKNTTNNSETYLKYFYNSTTGEDNELSQAVFEDFLNRKKVFVLLDGFDEISIMYKNEVTQIAKCLHDEGFPMCITTRPIMKVHLEDAFNTFSITLKPFRNEDQAEYLRKYFLTMDFAHSEEILNSFIRELLEAAKYNLFNADCEFTEIPLQTQLLADAFVNEYNSSLKTGVVNFNRSFDLLYLYEVFMDKKIDILCEKFGKDAAVTRVLFEENQELFSLKTVFEENMLLDLKIDEKLEEFCKNHKHEMHFLQREGVVVLDQTDVEVTYKYNVNFVHRTFAEYLAAKWLAENYNSKHETIRRTFKALVAKKYDVWNFNRFLFRMFDLILAKGCKFHLNVLNNQLDKVDFNTLTNEVDKCGRTVFHLLATLGVVHPSTHYSDVPKSNDKIANIFEKIDADKIIDIKDDLLGHNVLDYAIASHSLSVANKICEKSTNLSLNLDIPTFKKSRYFSYCVFLEYKALFKKLVPYFAARDMLIWNMSSRVIPESFCRLQEVKLQENPNFLNYIDDFEVETISNLFLFKYTNPTSPLPNYYSDLRFASVFGSMENIEFLLCENCDINQPDVDDNTPFHYAVTKGRLDVVQLYLTQGAEVNKPGREGNTALHLAAKFGVDEIIEELLSVGAEINKFNHQNNTPVHLAVLSKHYDTAQMLLLNGANCTVEDKACDTLLHFAAIGGANGFISEVLLRSPELLNKQNALGETPLHFALLCEQIHSVELLLLNGAKFDIKNNNSNYPLHYAAQYGHDKVILQLSKDVDINVGNNKGDTALHLAAEKNHLRSVELLLKHGASCNVKNNRDETPLHVATEKGFLEIISTLLKYQADINSYNYHNSTPLQLAIMCYHKDIVKLFLERNVNVTLSDKNGLTALHYAAMNGWTELASDLLSRGSDINAITIFKSTPLHHALARNKIDTVEVLLSHGAELHTENTHGFNLLHFASGNGNIDIINLLISAGVEINKETHEGNTPLHLAAMNGRVDGVKILIDNLAIVNKQNIFGKTPLHVSVFEVARHDATLYSNHLSTVRLLIERGADVNIQDYDGNTTLHYAAMSKGKLCLSTEGTENALTHFYNDVVALLVENGADVNLKNCENKTAIDLANSAGYVHLISILENNSDINKLSTSK